MRNKIIYQETYKKGVLVDKNELLVDVKKAKDIELLKMGKYADGTEFLVVKINVK